MLHFPAFKTITILAACLIGLVFALPNLFSEDTLETLPGWMPAKQINLGLDLQGGAYLLMEAAIEEVYAERLEAIADDVRNALRNPEEGERINYRDLEIGEEQVSVVIADPAQAQQAEARLEALSRPVGGVLALGTTANTLVIENPTPTRFVLSLSEPEKAAIQDRTIKQSLEIVRRRIDELGTKEPTIQRQGENRIVVQVPGEADPQRIIDILGRTAKLSFQLHDASMPVQEAIADRPPPGSAVFPSDNPLEPQILLKRRVLITGDRLTDAQPAFDEQGRPAVSFTFDSQGARVFARVTRDNVNKRFAVVLDGQVITAPNINTPITGGSGIIYGNMTVEESQELAVLLRSGALPASLNVLARSGVGPELGQESIEAGKVAGLIGFTAVIAFMLITYGRFGLFANISLIVNIVLIAGALSLFGATLTLPGIAGIVLTVGMAVDANVLIFERIREEAIAGKSPIMAVENGYQRARSSIFDANFTTFIAAIILFGLGAGPVRGFAVTLAIGVVTSVFTAFVLNRLIVSTWLRTARPKKLALA